MNEKCLEPYCKNPIKVNAYLCLLTPVKQEVSHVFCFFPTAISNPKFPKEPAKNFSFDYSYWSHTTVSS